MGDKEDEGWGTAPKWACAPQGASYDVNLPMSALHDMGAVLDLHTMPHTYTSFTRTRVTKQIAGAANEHAPCGYADCSPGGINWMSHVEYRRSSAKQRPRHNILHLFSLWISVNKTHSPTSPTPARKADAPHPYGRKDEFTSARGTPSKSVRGTLGSCCAT